MAAINKDRLAKFVGTVHFRDAGSTGAYTRFASVRGLVANIDATAKTVDVLSDDNGSVFKGYVPEANIEFELLENADADIIAKLFGGTVTTVAATPVAVTNEAHGTGWTVGQPFKLANKNGDSTIVTSASVKSGSTTLAANTDYKLFVADGTNGDAGYTYVTPLTAQSGAITANYTYTPSALKKTSIDMAFKEVPALELKIEAVDPANPTKIRTIRANSASFNGTYSLSFVDVVESGDIKGSTMVFTTNKGSKVDYEDGIATT